MIGEPLSYLWHQIEKRIQFLRQERKVLPIEKTYRVLNEKKEEPKQLKEETRGKTIDINA